MKTNKLILTGLFLAMCLILPQIFHPLNLGKVVSPMHFPVLLCGLFLGYQYGLLCGLLAPLIGGLLFGMPSFYPMGLSMAIELGIYGMLCGALNSKILPLKNATLRIYISLIIAMLVGRLSSALVNSILMLAGVSTTHFLDYMQVLFVVGLPGIVLQLLVIPPLALRLSFITSEQSDK